MSDLLCIGKGLVAERVQFQFIAMNNRRVFYSTRATISREIERERERGAKGRIFPAMTTRTRRAGRFGRSASRNGGECRNDASLRESPTTIGLQEGGRGRGQAVGKGTVLPSGRRRVPGVPRETPGSPLGIQDSNGVVAVRTRQEPGTVPGHTRGPSFLRDELVKFIESAKL